MLHVALLRKAIPKLYFHETLDATSLAKPTTHMTTTSLPSWTRLLFHTRIRVLALGLAHNTACLRALAVMWTTAAGIKCAGV